MLKSKQKLRRSQFILIYGPGAIIEGANGSRLIPTLEGLGEENCNDSFFSKYEIKDVRMSSMLSDRDKRFDHHLLSIPSNDAVGIDEDEDEDADNEKRQVIYSTIDFPSWHLCFKRNPPILYKNKIYDDYCSAYNEKKCVDCQKDKNPNVRFVLACPDGHLDDIFWNKEVHRNTKDCDQKYFYWKASGSSLDDIKIECPKCGASTNMQDIYKNPHRECSGRFPEKEELRGQGICYTIPKRNFDCDQKMKVIMKQSSALRFAITKTLLKIPEFDDSILDTLNSNWLSDQLKAIVKYKAQIKEEDLLEEAPDRLDRKGAKILEEYFQTHTLNDLLREFSNMEERSPDYGNAIGEEFMSLRGKNKESVNFSKSDFIDYDLELVDSDFPLKVCAINKLTTVTAQLYYQRNPYLKKEGDKFVESKQIPIGYLDEENEKMWYPAYNGVGEGIFITSDENPFEYAEGIEDLIDQWIKYNSFMDEDRPELSNPLFVWWHTLSHALIKSLSLSCGYNSTSLHERVYLNEETETGGILIYNTSPGDDSGMGGLVDLVENREEFEKVLKTAMDTIMVCSNDPLCSSNEIEDGGVIGSACYNCLMVSETSCEHQNKLLDRHFFI